MILIHLFIFLIFCPTTLKTNEVSTVTLFSHDSTYCVPALMVAGSTGVDDTDYGLVKSATQDSQTVTGSGLKKENEHG